MILTRGMSAPNFALPDQHGKIHTLRDYRGKTLVLYFYPRDNTPGCTMEAQEFTMIHADFTAKNATVVGVSADAAECHARFAERHSLTIPLLADTEHRLAKEFGVCDTETSLTGTPRIIRSTFVIDSGGTIIRVYERVRPFEHAQTVLADLSHELPGVSPTRTPRTRAHRPPVMTD